MVAIFYFSAMVRGIYDINEYCGKKINYDMDLKARRLLKNYVLYADYKKLAEFFAKRAKKKEKKKFD